MSATHLHFYQCSLCRSTAVATFHSRETHVDCPLCHRWMAYQWSSPVTTDEDRVLAARGLVLNPHLDDPNRLRHCDNCRKRVPVVGMINLSPAGKFCSEACADEGAAKHERYMQRQQELIAAGCEHRPWLLDQRQKESA